MKTMLCFAAALGLAVLSIPSIEAFPVSNTVQGETDRRGGNDHRKIKVIRGITVTGVNSVKGKPFMSWGPGPYGTFNFPTTFAFNPLGGEPLDIDENTPDSAILATGVSPLYLQIRGETPDVVKPEWVNVPLRKVPVNIDFDPSLTHKIPLKGLLEAGPAELSQAEPAADITLGQWMKASGTAIIDCSGNGANIKLRMKSLIPNRIYSVWATMGLAEPGSGSYSETLPVGGTPSIILTDEHGDATYKRWIKFCPFDKEATPHPMLTIELLYHANQSTYGAIPAPGIMLGLITFSHVLFPINVELLDN